MAVPRWAILFDAERSRRAPLMRLRKSVHWEIESGEPCPEPGAGLILGWSLLHQPPADLCAGRMASAPSHGASPG
jgi:hypothetical protein